MKQVIWTDDRGYKHVSIMRDSDPEYMAELGIPNDPPDITWILEDAKKELHNILVERGLLCYNDIDKSQGALTNAILGVIRNKIIMLYKQEKNEGGLNNV